MYLTKIFLKDFGPFEQFEITPKFDQNGNPLPIVIVGENGAGKTTVLAPIVDALFEFAANHYNDLLPHSNNSRNWFQTVGPANTKIGANSSVCLLKFKHESNEKTYIQKTGKVTLDGTRLELLLNDSQKNQAYWASEEAHKSIDVDDQFVSDILKAEQYVFFPSSRWEQPHWMNNEAKEGAGFSSQRRFNKKTQKPIFVENALKEISDWLPSLLLAARSNIGIQPQKESSKVNFTIEGNIAFVFKNTALFKQIESILQKILCENSTQLVWPESISATNFVVVKQRKQIALGLDGLSFGQATLFSIFVTLLRYQNMDQSSAKMAEDVTGICIIDEIDAHLHISLQNDVLPELVSMFPKVQFILTSHSPLFVLGMAAKFGNHDLNIIDVTRGRAIDAETYSEFQSALDAFKNTIAFEDEINSKIGDMKRPIIFMEGETDPIYLKTAIELLGHDKIKNAANIEWIGAKNKFNKQAENTGKNAMTKAIQFLNANPSVVTKTIIFVTDNDHDVSNSSEDKIYVLQLPKVQKNKKIKTGIESLLPSSCILKKHYTKKTSNKSNGTNIVSEHPDKMEICKYVCEARKNKNDFKEFEPLIDELGVALGLD